VSELRGIATDVYVWGSALVDAMRLRHNVTSPRDPLAARPPSSAAAALDNLGHQRRLSDPDLTVGVAPNVDTLYSLAWLDLDAGPFVLETPDFGDRYHTFQLAHANTECDLALGRRTHGSQLPPLLIHGPTYDGPVPDDVEPIRSRTRYFLVAGRVLVEPGVDGDVERVHALQRQMRLRPLAERRRADGLNDIPAQRPFPTADDVADPDLVFLDQLGAVVDDEVFEPADDELLAKAAVLGVVPGRGFDASSLGATSRTEVLAGLRDGDALVDAKIGSLGHSANGWSTNLLGPRFGSDHLLRAAVARNQIYVLPVEEALYPVARVDGGGQPLVGSSAYALRFDRPPPVDAFWSLTVYAKPGRLVRNPIDRYAIGDRTPGFRQGDGPVEVLLRHAPPPGATDRWLPVPAGEFHLMLRLYIPRPEAIAGTWAPPPVEPAGGAGAPPPAP
jgi:hypothetical protein